MRGHLPRPRRHRAYGRSHRANSLRSDRSGPADIPRAGLVQPVPAAKRGERHRQNRRTAGRAPGKDQRFAGNSAMSFQILSDLVSEKRLALHSSLEPAETNRQLADNFSGDQFESDCVIHHSVRRSARVSENCQKSALIRGEPHRWSPAGPRIQRNLSRLEFPCATR